MTTTTTMLQATGNSTSADRPGVYGKIAGLYDLEETLGVGHFAVVKLARHVFTGEKVAVKVIDKTKLDDVSRAHLFQEVRCMKLVQHPNVVRLYEVIDTQTKLYLILELGDGGDLYDYIMKHEDGLNEHLAREYFRQMVRAISYCHQLHVVHRDLKPENVLFFEKLGIIKLTDFGFSNKFCPGQKLETSCGSLAYSAPEILLGDSYDAPAVDVWSLGVILYMLVCGHLPFQEANDSETLTMIMDCKYTTPSHVSAECKQLIGRMLLREPEQRATLDEIAHHCWLTQDDSDHVPEYLPLVTRHQVSDDDHALIIQKIVNGNIATKEEILEALDKDEYNHITATYFLLAERRLKLSRPEQATVQRFPLSQQNAAIKISTDAVDGPVELRNNNNLLAPPSTGFYNNSRLAPVDTNTTTTGRTRKCSIVQEEDLDEDEAECERDDSSLNRRGSRSEGRINITVQDRLAESVRIKKDAGVITPSSPIINSTTSTTTATATPAPPVSAPARSIFDGICNVKILKPGDMDPNRLKLRKFTPLQLDNKCPQPEIDLTSTDEVDSINSIDECDRIKFLVDSATVQLPSGLQSTQPSVVVPPKFKTMPSPTRANTILPGALCLNEIFEEATDIGSSDTSATATPRLISRHTAFTNARSGSGGSHRRTKFHKSRTTSCSSSDDDDSESRKKRAHKMVDSTKPFVMQRRDSNDDSSDSQDPNPTCGGGGGGSGAIQTTVTVQISASNGSSDGGSAMDTSNAQETTAGRQRGMHGFRRHRTSRCRNNEIRLRESQSLNRITEVQDEDRLLTTSIQHANRSPALSTGAIEQTTERSASPSIASAQSINTQPPAIVSKPKSFGARLLAGFKRNTNHDSKQSNGKAVDDSKSKYNNNNDGGNKVPSSNGKQHTISTVDATNNPINWIKNSKPPLRVKAQQRFKNLKCLVDIFS